MELLPVELPVNVELLRLSAPGPVSGAASQQTAAMAPGSAGEMQGRGPGDAASGGAQQGSVPGTAESSGTPGSEDVVMGPSLGAGWTGDGSTSSKSSQGGEVSQVLTGQDEEEEQEEDFLMAALRANLQVSQRAAPPFAHGWHSPQM